MNDRIPNFVDIGHTVAEIGRIFCDFFVKCKKIVSFFVAKATTLTAVCG